MDESIKVKGVAEGAQSGIFSGKEFPLDTDDDVVKAIKETIEALGGKVQ